MHHDEHEGAGRDEEQPNRESNMEPAEGSRDNTNTDAENDLAGNQGGRGTSTMRRDEQGQSEMPSAAFGEGGQDSDNAGGISNRPLEEEQGRQESLPPRGERRDNWKED